ncbi:ribosomal protein S18 acetylase RimI-like enzyme [Streptomyces sp. CG 926]|uniref:GNAT family N-acetyltransferase n=1 Tax=Streptomyces sp. CG 926 TaxID=1882405 RepID=UPI000D6C5410|nr:GNAT family N-acetyltransferase [Streptomyces sp. CG 926]PWK69382.1 ribosomal protein S18 acetylase RimI-like enzyme [Streptomyces sp. CG 926]
MTTAHGSADTIVYRPARPEDAGAIEALDSSFTTATVFEVSEPGPDDGYASGFLLREVPVDPPVHKVFPPEEHDEQVFGGGKDSDADARTFVALDGELLCGYAAVGYAPWNRRLTVEDIEVAPGHRGRGIGRGLMECAERFARERGAHHLWLEVSSVNAPAVHAYRRMGFTFCGLDTALYDGTPAVGERALYMSRPCR